jgi:hypothetical protein
MASPKKNSLYMGYSVEKNDLHLVTLVKIQCAVYEKKGRQYHCHLELQALSQTACDVTRKAKRQNLTFVYIFRKYQIRCFNHSYGKL